MCVFMSVVPSIRADLERDACAHTELGDAGLQRALPEVALA